MCSSTLQSCFRFLTPPNRENSSLTINVLQFWWYPPLRLNSNPDDFKGTYHWFNFWLKCCKLANNWFYWWFLRLFPLCRALVLGFNLHFCLKIFGSNCIGLSCLIIIIIIHRLRSRRSQGFSMHDDHQQMRQSVVLALLLHYPQAIFVHN